MGRALEILGWLMIPVAIYAGLAAIALLLSIPLGWLYERKRRRERRELAEKNLLLPWPRLKARMSRMARPALLLVPAKQPGFSKIGGDPELPEDAQWPPGQKTPRIFVAQIDLAAFQPHASLDWLPAEGRLYFFYDDWRNGAADVVTVVRSDAPPAGCRAPPSPPPDRWRFKERRVGFMAFTSYPSTDWLDLDLAALDHEAIDKADEFADAALGDELRHQVGGYPDEIQSGQLAIECEWMRRGLERDYSREIPASLRRAARQWRLLLQVDSDDDLGMNWGDGGRLYVFIREQDARAGDFSQTVTITQSY